MKTIGVLICTLCAWSVWGGDMVSPQSFQLVCPQDVVLDCDDDLTNLSKWGDAYVLKDYKKISAGSPTVDDKRNSCGIGVITRTWKVQDPYSKWFTCTQTIEVKGGAGFGYADIEWPENWDIDTCQIDLNPRNLPDPYGIPKFANKKCAHPAYSYRDEVFDFSPTCTKVVRYWKVIDWCQYVPGGRIGIWERPQVFKIERGAGAPDVICPKDTTFMAEDCDSADVILEDILAIGVCGDTLKVKNSSPFADNPYGAASGRYPVGVHSFYYVIEYGCARELKCKVTITVRDAKPPTPYCKNGIITTLMPVDTNADGTIDDGMREVWASDLNAGSFHACDPDRKLIYSFSSDTSDKVINFTCENLGKNEVEIWVTDELGNQSFCITYVEVQNNNPNLTDCEPDSLKGGVIQGSISAGGGQMVSATNVIVNGVQAGFTIDQNNDTVWQDLQLSHQTKDDGLYAFKRLPMYKEYSIELKKADDVLNGVDIWDYYTLYYHLNGFFPFQDSLQWLAADVNGDLKLNYQDAQRLISVIMFSGDSSLHFPSWCFFEQDQIDRWKRKKEWPQERPGHITNMTEKYNEIEWTGLKLGDLDFSASPNGILTYGSSLRSTSELHIVKSHQPGVYVLEVPQNIAAMDITLDLGQEFPVEVDDEDGVYSVIDGQEIHIAWIRRWGEPSTISLSFADEVELDEISMLDAVLYDLNGKVKNGVLIPGEIREKDQAIPMIVYPNPVGDVLTLYWESTHHHTEVSVYNVLGQPLVHQYLGALGQGPVHANIDVKDLESNGTYLLQLIQGDKVYTQSFIKE